jgi:hypothetical protein
MSNTSESSGCWRPLLRGFVLGAFIFSGPALAQDEQSPKLTPLPEAPEPPPRVKSGEVLEPDVRIFRRAKERITEYRVNGQVRAIKVEPDVGPAYYLIDNDGDGKLDSRRYGPDFVVPKWVLFSW